VDRAPLLCDDCADLAWREHETERAEEDAYGHARRLEARRVASGVPELLRGLELTDPDPARAHVLKAAKVWAIGGSSGLVLGGDVGVGKTHMAAAAAWQRMHRERLKWLSVPVLFAHLALSFDNRIHEAAVEALAGTGALVLDDLDKAKASEYGAQQIFTAVDQRVTAGGALLVTTNLRLSQLAARWPEPFGDAIVDRLASYCQSFHLEGQSRRRLGGTA